MRAGQWLDATEVDVAITLIPGAPSRLPAQLRAAVGSGEQETRARVLGGDHRFARLRFDVPVPLVVGDRMVLRDPARSRTIAGAEVLDVGSLVPARRAASVLARPTVVRLLEGHGWLQRDDLVRLVGLDERGLDALLRDAVDRGDAVVVGEWWALPDDVEALRGRAPRCGARASRRGRAVAWARARCARRHAGPTDAAGARRVRGLGHPRRDPRGCARAGARGERGGERRRARPAGRARRHAVLATGAGRRRARTRALVREGALVDVDGIVFTSDAIGHARALLRAALVDGGSITVGDARELLGSTRKFVVPLLERFDREGFTRRRGDVRIAGPRLDAAGDDQP